MHNEDFLAVKSLSSLFAAGATGLSRSKIALVDTQPGTPVVLTPRISRGGRMTGNYGGPCNMKHPQQSPEVQNSENSTLPSRWLRKRSFKHLFVDMVNATDCHWETLNIRMWTSDYPGCPVHQVVFHQEGADLSQAYRGSCFLLASFGHWTSLIRCNEELVVFVFFLLIGPADFRAKTLSYMGFSPGMDPEALWGGDCDSEISLKLSCHHKSSVFLPTIIFKLI